jgi:uncharacterized protein (TIGR02271 family)
MAFAPTESKVATAGVDTVAITNLSTERELFRIPIQSPIRDIAFSPDGSWFVAGFDDHRIRVWDTLIGNELLSMSQDGRVTEVVVSSDGRWIMTRAAFTSLPDYTGANLARDYDDVYRGHLSTAYPPKRITRSAEELRIDKRLEKKGDVRVAKHVETERVRQEVPVQKEQVHVERRPVTRTAGTTPEFRDDEIVVPVMEEEVVVEKRPVVKEELVISKEPVTTTKTVETDLRHEEFDVDRSSGDVHINDKKTRGGR